MKALQNPNLTLTQLLDAGKAMEMSKTQAKNIEDKQEITKMSGKYSKIVKNSQRSRKQHGGLVDRKSNYSTSRERNSAPGEKCKCRNCGKGYPYPGGKTSCRAYGKLCHGCGKQNHFEAVCRSKYPNKRNQPKNQKRGIQNLVDENSSSEESDDIAYTFSVNSTSKEQSHPMFKIIVQTLQ